MNRFRKPIVMLVFALGMTLLAAAPAQASYSEFNFMADTGYGGSGITQGSIETQPYPYGSSYRVGGQVRDRCPADGKGIALRGRARSAGGTAAVETVISDTNGCGSTWESTSTPYTLYTSFAIGEARAELWSTEGSSPFQMIGTSTWRAA